MFGALARFRPGGTHWLAHGGASVIGHVPVFVSEPLLGESDALGAARFLQAAFGCPVSYSRQAEWSPRCCRIVLWYTLFTERFDGRNRGAFVDGLERAMCGWGYRALRDVNEVGDGGLIREFVPTLVQRPDGRPRRVVLVLSDKYLRSVYCMTELHAVWQLSLGNRAAFARSAVPCVIEDDLALDDWRGRKRWSDHWKQEYDAMTAALDDLCTDDRCLRDEIGRWKNDVGQMLTFVSNMVTALSSKEAAERITGSGARAAIVAAVDDWAVYELDQSLRLRLLEIARQADPGDWMKRLRDPAVREDEAALAALAAVCDPARTSPAALSVLAELMSRKRLALSPLLTAARAAHPREFELAFLLGQWSGRRKDGQEIGPYEAARALRPENFAVWNNLGLALREKGDLAGAIVAYKSAIELDPKYAPAHHNLGVAYLGQKQYPEAIACAREAIKADPKLSNAHALLGDLLLRTGDISGARAVLAEAARLDKRWAELLASLPSTPVAPPPREVKRP